MIFFAIFPRHWLMTTVLLMGTWSCGGFCQAGEDYIPMPRYGDQRIEKIFQEALQSSASRKTEDAVVAIRVAKDLKSPMLFSRGMKNANVDIRIKFLEELSVLAQRDAVAVLVTLLRDHSLWGRLAGSENATIQEAFEQRFSVAVAQLTGKKVAQDVNYDDESTRADLVKWLLPLLKD
jgi:hypothetical protein